MKSSRFLLALSAAAVCFASPAAAQDQATQPVDSSANIQAPADEEEYANNIIVEGYTEKQVRQFLWRSAIETGDAMAKRSTPICLGIDNAPESLSNPLRDHIHANLEMFQVPIAEEGCKPNTIIVFHRDAKGFVDFLDDEHPYVFNAMFKPERRRLIGRERAAYSWHYLPTEVSSLEPGNVVAQVGQRRGDAQQLIGFDSPGGRNIPTPAPKSTHSFSVVDFDAINGLTIEQVGDYLTMQMLAEFRPDNPDEVPSDSILTLFENTAANSETIPGFSRMDRVILSELYSPNRINFRTGALRQAIASAAISQLDDEGLILASSDE